MQGNIIEGNKIGSGYSRCGIWFEINLIWFQINVSKKPKLGETFPGFKFNNGIINNRKLNYVTP